MKMQLILGGLVAIFVLAFAAAGLVMEDVECVDHRLEAMVQTGDGSEDDGDESAEHHEEHDSHGGHPEDHDHHGKEHRQDHDPHEEDHHDHDHDHEDGNHHDHDHDHEDSHDHDHDHDHGDELYYGLGGVAAGLLAGYNLRKLAESGKKKTGNY